MPSLTNFLAPPFSEIAPEKTCLSAKSVATNPPSVLALETLIVDSPAAPFPSKTIAPEKVEDVWLANPSVTMVPLLIPELSSFNPPEPVIYSTVWDLPEAGFKIKFPAVRFRPPLAASAFESARNIFPLKI